MKETFRKIAIVASRLAGSAWVFLFAALIVAIWAVTGPYFDYSNTWQLLINTFTTISTFLIVFLIQNTQNRDSKAMQLKLDELIRATKARESFMDIEDLSDDELGHITEEFRRVHEQTGHPAIKKFHAKLEAAHKTRKK
jgi:low affinity Fe/Cu permease